VPQSSHVVGRLRKVHRHGCSLTVSEGQQFLRTLEQFLVNPAGRTPPCLLGPGSPTGSVYHWLMAVMAVGSDLMRQHIYIKTSTKPLHSHNSGSGMRCDSQRMKVYNSLIQVLMIGVSPGHRRPRGSWIIPMMLIVTTHSVQSAPTHMHATHISVCTQPVLGLALVTHGLQLGPERIHGKLTTPCCVWYTEGLADKALQNTIKTNRALAHKSCHQEDGTKQRQHFSLSLNQPAQHPLARQSD
jgi:hypothetical protein